MTPAELKERIDRIKEYQYDDQSARSLKNDLYEDVLSAIAGGECSDPVECARVALTTKEIDFARLCE